MRFHGDGMYQWDTWYFNDDGLVHAFYLQQIRPNSTRSQRDADSIGHAVSDDLVTWRELPPAVPPAEQGQEGDLVNWTGSTVEHDGRYYLFYTIRSSSSQGRVQGIGLATSDDLMTWTKHPANPILTPDARWYNTEARPGPGGVVDCRDLMVVKHPTRSGWFGVWATRVVGDGVDELPQGAVFAGAYSDDLVHWEQTGPVYRAPDDAYSIVEMPDLFEYEGRWYLTWLEDNNYGNREVLGDVHLTSGTVYATADRIEGPYEAPEDNVILASTGFNGISCRTVDFRGRKYVLYTSCEREQENELKPTFGALSLPKEVRLVDGRLRAAFAPLVLEELGADRLIDPAVAPEVVPVHSTHETRIEWDDRSGWSGTVRTAWARRTFEPTADDFVASVQVTMSEGTAASGLIVRQEGTRGGVALLDLANQRVSFCTVPRFQVVDSRPYALETGREYLLRVIGNGEFIEVYLDEVLVLQFVWYGPRGGRIGLLIDRGTAAFSDLEATALRAREGASA